MTGEGVGHHSADGALWWDGATWWSAYSHDRSRWFDGTGWIMLRPRWYRWSKGVGVAVIVAVVTLVIPVVGVAFMGAPVRNPRTGRIDDSTPPAWLLFAPWLLLLVGVALVAAPAIHRRSAPLTAPPPRQPASPPRVPSTSSGWPRTAGLVGVILLLAGLVQSGLPLIVIADGGISWRGLGRVVSSRHLWLSMPGLLMIAGAGLVITGGIHRLVVRIRRRVRDE